MERNLIGKRLREARISEKPPASLADISARLATIEMELGDNAIGKIERGERPVSDIQLVAFSYVLKVSPLWLLGKTDDKKLGLM